MSELENIESKAATFVGGSTKSLQFYALRHKLEWAMSAKTRSIVSAMQGEWGSELDIVTMLALSAMPVKRDWQRFDEEYEIVDLGRNKAKAKRTFYTLRSQANDERYAQDRAKHEVQIEITKWVAAIEQRRENARVNQATRAQKHGLWGVLSNAARDEVQAEIASTITSGLIAAFERGAKTSVALLSAIEPLQAKSAGYNPFDGCDFEDTLRPMIWQSQRPAVIGELTSFRNTALTEERARQVLRDRRATVDKVADQLSNLGLQTGDL